MIAALTSLTQPSIHVFHIRLSSCKDATITNHLVGIFADGVSWVLHRLKRHSPLVPLFVFLNNDNHVFKKPLTFIAIVAE